MTTRKRSLLLLLQLAVCYVLITCISVFAPEVFLVRKPATFPLLGVSVALLLFFADHIIEEVTRRYLVGIASLITVWIVLRGAKYIAFEETEIIARHIWYLYYVPVLFIALLSLMVAFTVGEERPEKYRRIIRPAIAVTWGLAVCVLTNDLHQLVFRFRPGFANWDFDYSHTFLFYLIYGWIALLLVASIAILFVRCRVSASRRLVWIPLLPILFGILYLTLNAAGLWPRVNGELFGEFPEAVCFTMAGAWLSLIYIGLIPSNIGYGRLFRLSGISAQIADRDGRIIYRSEAEDPLPGAESGAVTESGASADASSEGNIRIHSKEVQGGYVYWQDDITELNRINAQLLEVGERLGEEAELLRLENELKEERAQIETKTRTYDEIAEQVSAQSLRINALCEEAETAPERYERNAGMICLLAAYIKRYANLSLLAAEGGSIESGELELAIRESLRYVGDLGIRTDCFFTEKRSLGAQRVLESYALFERLLEQALPALRGLQVTFAQGELKCVLEGAADIFPEDFSEGFPEAFPKMFSEGWEARREGDAVYVRIREEEKMP